MSNTAVGGLYKRIMEAVIENSRGDFEENGVDSGTIQTFQEKWQKYLTQSQRARFSWDPQPSAPIDQPEQSPVITSTARPTPSASRNAASASPAPSQQGGATPVKVEPGLDQKNILNPPQATAFNSDSRNAHQRAENLVKQQFGAHAMSSIGSFQAGNTSAPSGGQQKPGMQYPNPPARPQAQQQPRVKEESKPVGLGAAQHDGADEAMESWRALIERKNAQGDYEPMGRINADRIVRRHAQAVQQRLEAGGLLVPLDEQYPPNVRARKGKEPALQSPSNDSRDPLAGSSAPSSKLPTSSGKLPAARSISGLDGGDEDDDDEKVDDDLAGEDAINSDLDDSEDELNENIEGNEFEGDQILCLYDKVQRVKNKWKCTLKEGIATVDGKDYVFHKANGEFEW